MQFKTWNWDRILLFTCLGILFFVLFNDCVREDPKDYDQYIREFDKRWEETREEIKREVINELQKNYENIDTVSTSSGANDNDNDFRFRSGNRHPPYFKPRE